MPWLTKDHTVRVGASVTFDKPVVLDYRFGWKLQPQRQVVGVPTGLVTFEQDRPAAPAAVGGDLRLATFNVLNYFTTLGEDVAGCTAYVGPRRQPDRRRTARPATARAAPGTQANLARQQAKIVNAINTMDADVVSLEELENSKSVDGTDRDEAIGALVKALNTAAGTTRWAYVPSPAAVDPGRARTSSAPASSTTRRPSRPSGPARSTTCPPSTTPATRWRRSSGARVRPPRRAFAVIVNHFKSKGSGTDDGTGQGNANPDRVAQANALTAFASSFATARGTDKVFLTGDFNAYSMEDPVQAIEAAGSRVAGVDRRPGRGELQLRRHVGLARPRLRQLRGQGPGERRRRVGDQRQRVDVLPVQPLQLHRHRPLHPVRVRRLGPQPRGGRRSRRRPSTPVSPPRTVTAKVTPQRVVVDRTRAVAHVTVTKGDKKDATGGPSRSARARPCWPPRRSPRRGQREAAGVHHRR